MNVLDDVEVGLFRLGIVRVAGHGDVALGMILVDGGVEFAPLQQPAFEFGHALAPGGGGFQFVVKRDDLIPVAAIQIGRDKSARLAGRQRIKGQQIHGERIDHFRGMETRFCRRTRQECGTGNDAFFAKVMRHG